MSVIRQSVNRVIRYNISNFIVMCLYILEMCVIGHSLNSCVCVCVCLHTRILRDTTRQGI